MSGAMEGGEKPSKQNHNLLVFHLFPPSHRPLRGSSPPAKTSQKGEGDNQCWIGQLLPQRLLFWFSPTPSRLGGRVRAGREAGSRAGCQWSSFSSLARPPGRPKTCTDRCGQKGTSGKLTHLSHKSLYPCAEKWARNQAQNMGSFFERPSRPARLGFTYFANNRYIACPAKIHPEYFPLRSPSRPRRRGASSPRASRRRRIGNPC